MKTHVILIGIMMLMIVAVVAIVIDKKDTANYSPTSDEVLYDYFFNNDIPNNSYYGDAQRMKPSEITRQDSIRHTVEVRKYEIRLEATQDIYVEMVRCNSDIGFQINREVRALIDNGIDSIIAMNMIIQKYKNRDKDRRRASKLLRGVDLITKNDVKPDTILFETKDSDLLTEAIANRNKNYTGDIVDNPLATREHTNTGIDVSKVSMPKREVITIREIGDNSWTISK